MKSSAQLRFYLETQGRAFLGFDIWSRKLKCFVKAEIGQEVVAFKKISGGYTIYKGTIVAFEKGKIKVSTSEGDKLFTAKTLKIPEE